MVITRYVFLFLFLVFSKGVFSASLYLGEPEKWNLKSSGILVDSLTLSGEKIVDRGGARQYLSLVIKKLDGSEEDVAAAIKNLPELAKSLSVAYAEKCIGGAPKVLGIQRLSGYYFSCEARYKIDSDKENTHVVEGVIVKSGYFVDFTLVGDFSGSSIEESLLVVTNMEIR